MQLLQISKRFQYEQIDAALNQRRDLFAESGASFLIRSLAQGFNANSEGTNRARNPHVETFGGFTTQSCSSKIDLADPVLHAVAGQPKGIPSEGIGFDDLGASLQIFVM